ncbi:MAG: hypothetical protein R3Y66_04520 [Rikenellaceae bacterium]
MVAGGLLFIFAAYFINISLFSHYHIVDGVTIVHSHFYSGDHADNPDSSTAHSENEITLIQAISNFLVESPSDPFILRVAYTNVEIHFIESNERILSVASYSHPPLRAPPIELIIG